MSDAMYGQMGRMRDYPPGVRAVRRDDGVHDVIGRRIDDVNGRRLGTVDAVLVSRVDARNLFLLVHDRAGHLRAVPTEGVLLGGGRVWTPHPKSVVDRGPILPAHGIVGPRTERALRRLFRMPDTPQTTRGDWDRRASLARAARDPAMPGVIMWWPGPRPAESAAGDVRRTPPVERRPPLPGGLPDRRRLPLAG